MTIVFVVHNLGRERVGGVERVATEIANELCRDHDISIVSVLRDDVPFFSLSGRVRRDSLQAAKCDTDGLSRLGKLRWTVFVLWQLFRMTRRYGADAVYVAHSPRLGFLLSVIACLKPIRLLVCEHQSHDSLRSRVYRKLRVWTYRRAALVCLTPRDRSFFASHGLRAFQVQNFVSPSLAPFAPRDLDKRLIYVGRLDIPQKAVDKMLRIIMASGLLREGYEMVFAGEGAAHELLQREAAKSPDAERIRFLPFSKNVKGLYGQGAVFLLTSNYEGFPLCLIEAMSQGLPCVAFDCDSGPRDVIVDGVNGYLIPLDDEASFVKAIRCATDSAASYAALSSGAVGTAGRYTIARSCEQWLSAMRGIGYAA